MEISKYVELNHRPCKLICIALNLIPLTLPLLLPFPGLQEIFILSLLIHFCLVLFCIMAWSLLQGGQVPHQTVVPKHNSPLPPPPPPKKKTTKTTNQNHSDKQASNLEAYESSPDKVCSLLGVHFSFWFSYREACLGKSDRLCLLWIFQANEHRKQECLDSRLLVNAQNSLLSPRL